MNALLNGNMRTPFDTGVSAEITPLGVPPEVVVGAEHVIELVGGVWALALVAPALANAYTAAAAIFRSPKEWIAEGFETDCMISPINQLHEWVRHISSNGDLIPRTPYAPFVAIERDGRPAVRAVLFESRVLHIRRALNLL